MEIKIFFAISLFAILLSGCNINAKPGPDSVPVAGVSLDRSALYLVAGSAPVPLTAGVLPENADNQDVSWSSADTDVARVDSSGTVTPVGTGETVVTVTTNDGGFTAGCTVTVTPAAVPVEQVILNLEYMYLEANATQQLTASIEPANASNRNLSWSSANEAVAAVDSDGTVSALAIGTAVITVTAEDGGHTDSCTVTVSPAAVTGISLNTTTLTLETNKTAQLTAVIEPADAADKSVSWLSDNTAVATVDGTGLVRALSAGNAVITVTTNVGPFTAQCAVTVAPIAVSGITLDADTRTMTAGNTFRLTAEIMPADAQNQTVLWASLDPSVAAVDETGNVSGIAAGKTVVTATAEDGGFEASCRITVFPEPGLVSFSFRKSDNDPNVPLDISAAISGTDITVNVPFTTDKSTLIAEFVPTEGSEAYVIGTLQQSGISVNDFSAPLTYRIKTPDGIAAEYRVTVISDEKQSEELYRNRAYGSHKRNICDVYLPEDRYFHTPVILFMHGGGWIKGDKSEFASLCREYRARGYACVTMNYRFTTEAGVSYLEIMDDISRAIEFIASHAGEWRISVKFALAGFSAGAVNAVLYPYGFDEQGYVKACVAFSGAYDMNDPVTRDALNRGMGQDIILMFAGSEENFDAASPLHTLKNVPSLIFHGKNDRYMDAETHVTPFIEALEENNIDHQYTLYQNTGHSTYFLNDHHEDVTDKMNTWFNLYLWE